MKIKKILSQHRRDFTALYACEHCGHERESSGYDDANFHDNVIPTFQCHECGKRAADDYRPLTTKYKADKEDAIQLQTFLREQFGNERPEVKLGDILANENYVFLVDIIRTTGDCAGIDLSDGERGVINPTMANRHYRNGELLWERK